MQIVVRGVNHASAPLSVRESLFVSEEQLASELAALRDIVEECFLLSTCNRTEVYIKCGHEGTGADLLREWFASRGDLTTNDVERYSYVHAHEAAVVHAFRVAAGLDSMVVGEDQILGQLRRALSVARDAGGLGPLLDRLGSSALACGKRVRSSDVGGRAPSVVSVGIEAAVRTRGTLANAQVVVVGSGEMATLAIEELLRESIGRLTVVNRTPESAAALALAHDVEAAPWHTLPALLGTADVVVSCTSSSQPVIAASTIREARQAIRDRQLVCVDLGVPRDIESSASSIDGVTLIDIDRVGAVAGTRTDGRADFAAAAEIVSDEVERFMTWWRERDVAPAIARLHDHARRIADAELERALARLPELSARDREVVRALATRITSKLLHDPTLALKRDPEGPNMAVMLQRLFPLMPRDDDRSRDDTDREATRVVSSTHHAAE